MEPLTDLEPPPRVDAPREERAVTVDEALSVAVLMQQQGQLDDAQEIYRKVLAALPGHPDAAHFLGLLLHQRGDHAGAAALIERLLAEYPDHADAWSNLGLVLKSDGRLEAAAEAFQRAITLNPRHANAYSNLGILLRAQGRVAEAETAYGQALAIDPGHARAHHNLGALLEGCGRISEAVVAYGRACVLDPANAESKRLLAHAYCTIGERAKAVEVLRSWLAAEPDHPIAAHLLAACSGENVPARASDACVEQMFDAFADSFDTKLKKLSYQAPQLTLAMLAEALPPPAKSLELVDAGCGTGLCGPLLAPYARRLVGVDLSARMLVQALERGVYDELVKDELTVYLRRHPRAFDAIVSADTLVYFGDLHEALGALAGALKSGGVAVFSLERAEDAADPRGFVLETHGRYSHTESYVRALLESAGLEPLIARAELRMEAGRPVQGLVVRGVRIRV
jgi:predicted TPR repeat methyltransferase